MLVAISWLVVLTLAVAYSACVWLMHAATVWFLSGVGALGAASSPTVSLDLPPWLAVWVPPEWALVLQSGAGAVLPWVESAVSLLPSLGQWLTPLAWVLWGVGLLVLVLGGGIVHALLAMTRRSSTQ